MSVQLAGAKAQVLTYLTTLEKQVEVPKSASHQQVIQVVLFRVSEKMRMSMGVRLCGRVCTRIHVLTPSTAGPDTARHRGRPGNYRYRCVFYGSSCL